MNEFSFNCILPLVNKDVDVIESYESNSSKIKCRCKLCGEYFTSTPNDLISGRLHRINNCRYKWSQYNKLSRDFGNIEIAKLDIIYKKYANYYNFSNYLYDDRTITLLCKKCGKSNIINVDDESRKKRAIKCNCNNKDETEKITNNKKNKEYLFFDIEEDIEILCTVNQLSKYAGRTDRYYYIKEIKNKNWFKKRFKLVRNYNTNNISQDLDENDYYTMNTYILRKCNNSSFCHRTGKYKCDNCKIDNTPYYSVSEYLNIVKSKNPNIDLISKFESKTKPILCKCKECGFEFFKQPKSLLHGVNCRNCKASGGEQHIYSYLKSLNIEVEKEKRFPDLIDKKPLRFDFYLPEYNAVIEFDGKQHFEPNDFFYKTYDMYLLAKNHDRMKMDFCKRNNIQILHIKYDNDDIKNTIFEFINNIE